MWTKEADLQEFQGTRDPFVMGLANSAAAPAAEPKP